MIRYYCLAQEGKHAGQEEKLKTFHFVYTHGELENKVGYDIILEDVENHFDRRRNINGEECIAVLPSGEEIEARLFRWRVALVYSYVSGFGKYIRTHRMVRFVFKGLLVSSSDQRALKDAQTKFDHREKEI